jgi:ABC-type sugar transport system substrate-binding protein
MDQVIADAMDAGIPVISTNSDDSEGAKGNARIATVNQDHYNAGYAMGERIAAIHPDGGKVMLSWCTAGAVPLEKRMAGVKDGIADSNPKIEVVDPILNYGTVEADVPNNIEAAYLANPDVVGIYSVDGYSTGITKFIQNNNLKGKVKGGGWDLLQINLDGVKDGTIEFCLGQDPYSQGFFPIASLWLYLEKGVVPKNIDTGAEFCDINNVDVIYAREQEYWQ